MKKSATFLLLSCLLVLSLTILPSVFATRSAKRAKVASPRQDERARKVRPRVSTPDKTPADTLHPSQRFKGGTTPVPVSVQAARFAVTPPLDQIKAKRRPNQSMRRGKAEANEERPEKIVSPPLSGHVDITGNPDANAAQGANVAPLIPATIANFEGLSNLDNAADPVIAGLVLPPDTVGDVGPTQYVQATNLLFRVFDKSGTALTPPRPISFLFTSLGGRCATTDDGDPIVLYDSFADRWIITQFAVSGAAPLAQCFAISQTGDATGAYFTYEFVMPNNKFNDYPHFGVWPDGYYLSNNQFNLAGTAFLGVGVFALDRAKILAGDATASYIYFDLETAIPNARSMLPSDADGLIPPPAGAPNVFSYFNANEFTGDLGDSLRLFDFHADFAVPANSTFTERADSPLAVAAFSPTNPAGLDDIEQPPPATPTSALDSIQDRLMNRLQYRNYGAHEALVVNHTVNVGTGTTLATHQAGVRYYELRRTLPSGAWTVREQGTHAPDLDNRWMGSAAMDHEGNLAVGYSVSSTTVFPGIRYAGRLAADPLGSLGQGEGTIIAGTGVQTNTGSRWGDYSSINVDPVDDCTFFYTTEYYATTDTTPNDTPFGVPWQTRIGSFRVNPSCLAPAQGTVQVNVTNCDTGLPVVGATVSIDGNIYGTSLAGGSFSTQLTPGTYTVSASSPTFTPGTANAVVVTNGNTTVVNVCISPSPVIEPDGSALTAESCAPATGAIDPGETVTVDLSLENNGSAPTSNLVATLLATGGVTNPSGPQNYGAIPIGGSSVTRPFTFTADAVLACGGTLTATLQLQDGATDLGTATYTFTTGALSTPRPAITYSSGNIAVPLPDNTTVNIPINVPDAGAVNDINVRFRMNHTFVGDVEVRLVHPDGTIVLLSDNRGGAGQNYGTGANDCSGTPTVFDDSASVGIANGTAPFAGSFRPEQPLSALNGKPTAGTWTLRVSDTANGDTGTIGCVQLEISRRIFLCCPFTGGTATVAAAPPATIATESCSVNNGAPDPGETVTMNFPLQNTGTGPTTNLVATLLATGGVTNPSGPQNYGVLSPVGPPVSRPFTFTAAGTCGGTITATLQLQDGATNLGTVSFSITIGGTATIVSPFSNPAPITILDTPRVGGIAPSSPYPSTIAVSGLTGTVSKVTVTLNGYGHSFPNDVDVLLVGPGGQRLLLMSDVGGTVPATGVSPTFDDAAAGTVPSPIVTGTFRPTNSGTGDTFPAPAPAGPYPDPQLLSVFNGVNPNGTWSLHVVDDAGTDAGSITGGWTLNISVTSPSCCTSSANVGQVLISEFRFRGPASAADEFVELYNNTNTDLDISGYTLHALTGAGAQNLRFTVPGALGSSTTIIPARGHFLITGASYTLAAYAASNGTLSTGIVDGSSIGFFAGATPTAANRIDSAGFDTRDALFFEGTAITPSGAGTGGITVGGEYSFVRKMTNASGGLPQDTENNNADFFFLSVTGGVFSTRQSMLGAPGPENLASPIVRNGAITLTLLDPGAGNSASPNRARTLTSDPPNNSTFGTLAIRRTVTNNTGAPVTRLRFRIIDFTTFAGPVPAGTADLRARTSTPLPTINITGPNSACPANICPMVATTLEEPPTQAEGGGVNSSLSVGTIPLTPSLANGASLNVEFLLGVEQTGHFRFFVNIEALP
ncbi:MAG: proprotein convertase P-domain-containing protein [Rubrivivax sp.]|nr:proprotein convertase P-domain-containing protein [Pyrinomonadaceae bacterium]